MQFALCQNGKVLNTSFLSQGKLCYKCKQKKPYKLVGMT